ncbi:hypothetical protein D9757_004488 [Collybiopsis confluens]|uniref:F-box domain-containing protein n=1 Tax=Collybiopsis confluens TaxID=2823264 RepID=A0A8H5HWS4_9AGAR|nr:hypothetical protein D9757_004488 [Collybiopsis confluens]
MLGQNFSSQRKKVSWSLVNPFHLSFINSQLRAGYMPSGPSSQKERVLSLLEILEGDTLECYQEIIGAEHKLEQLKHAHHLLESTLMRARSIVSPIRKLPTEILQAIFEQFMSNWDYSLSIGLCCRLYPILSITQVCSHWRETAHSLPGLWASISVNFYFPEGVSIDMACVMRHLSRSRNTLLKISVTGCNSSNGIAPDQALQLWHILLEQSHRWSKVNLFVSNRAIEQASAYLASKDKDPFPNLQSLARYNLSGLKLLSIDFDRLTYLNLSLYTGSSLDELFRLFSHLKVCTLGGYLSSAPAEERDVKRNVLVHRNLEELHLHSEKLHSPRALQALFFPNLKTLCLDKDDLSLALGLSVTGSSIVGFPSEEEICGLLRRTMPGVPRCSLENLFLTGYDVQSALSIISAVQDTISRLEIQDPLSSQCDILLSLSLSGPNPLTIPGLRSLRVVQDGMWDDVERKEDLVCNLVESRCRIVNECQRSRLEGLQQFRFCLDTSVDIVWAERARRKDGQGRANPRLTALERLINKRDAFYERIQTRLAPFVLAGLELGVGVIGLPDEDSDTGEGEGQDDDEGEDEGDSDDDSRSSEEWY